MAAKTMPRQKRGESKQTYGTPWDFIRACEVRFGRITFDLAASEENAKAPRFYCEKDDSLSKSWAKHGGVLWLNPPFAHVRPWAAKCAIEAERGARILFLTPVSAGSNWFLDSVLPHALVYALRPRLTFEGESEPFIKDLCLSVFGYGVSGFVPGGWRWRPLKPKKGAE